MVSGKNQGGFAALVNPPFFPRSRISVLLPSMQKKLILFQSKQTNGFYFNPSGHRKALAWDRLVTICNSLSCLQVLEISLEHTRRVSAWL